jgi:hypothetical protein
MGTKDDGMRAGNDLLKPVVIIAGVFWLTWNTRAGAGDARYASHRPMRALPTAATRPLPEGPVYFVDARHGSNDGPFIGTAGDLRFHHNLVDNFNDDGVYLTSMS